MFVIAELFLSISDTCLFWP